MTKKTRIRIWIVTIIIGLMGFSDWSFAAEGDGLKILGMSLNYIVSVLAWIWIFFAKLAGTFLTNNWIYGEVLGLDSLLWKYWNVIKNIANFGLGFYFVYVIFRGLINQGKEDITKKLKDIILWLLIAGVGIQASWFFVATVIDVSTITLAAAGSFPSQVLSESPYVESAMRKSLSDYLDANEKQVVQGKEISLFPRDQNASSLLNTKTVKLVYAESFTGLVDSLMPNANDVSGPLYFIGFTILKTNVLTSIDSSSANGVKGTILNTLIQGGTTIIFAIEMLVLCIIALIRVIYLWMFIVLSPLAVLIRCIEKSREKLGNGDGFLSKFTKQISFKTFFINVFKPTIIVLGFGIAIIFVALMNKVILDYSKNKIFNMNGMTIQSEEDPQSSANGNIGDKTYTTVMDNDFLHFSLTHSGKTLLEIVLSIATVLIVYLIIDFAVKMGNGEDFVSKSIDKVQNGVNSLMGSAPVFPVPAYDKYGKPKVGGLGRKSLSTVPGAKIQSLTSGLKGVSSKQTDKVMEMWGFSDGLTQERKTKIANAGNGLRGLEILGAKKQYIDSIKNNEGMGMTLSSSAGDGGFWKKEFERWLNERVDESDYNDPSITPPKWRDLIDDWKQTNPTDKTKRSLQALFNMRSKGYAQIYANFFGYNSGNYTDFDSIMNLDISKK